MRITTLLALPLALSISATAAYSDERHGILFDYQVGSRIALKTPAGKWRLVEGLPRHPPTPSSSMPLIGVIDSGVLSDHPQLRGRIVEQRDFTGEGAEDRVGHGTVVSILTWAGTGQVSPLVIAKVAHVDGTISKVDLIAAIAWVAARGVRVVNLSLGFREGTDDYSDLCLAITNLDTVLFVAAAGNYGPNVRVYPAACKTTNLLSVGANEGDLPASYSGEGEVYAPGGVKLIEEP